MKSRAVLSLACSLGVAALTMPATAQLFFANFESDHTADWTVNTLGTGSDANFFFDYSTVGIPKAPNSALRDGTYGLRLRANQFSLGGTFPSGVSVSPLGQSFGGNYSLRFDMWLNFNGPGPAGGSGSTQITGAGIGTAGTSAQIAGGVIDSLSFGVSGEGGSSVDYRAYAPAFQTGLTPETGVFAAGTHSTARNNSDPYYAGFGGLSAPAEQLALFPQQTGTTAVGALAWAWHDVELLKVGNLVSLSIDGLRIATGDVSVAGTLGGDNILFNYYDINATASTDPNSPFLLFGLIDNVLVDVVPEPGTVALFALGGLGLLLGRRKRS